MSFVLNDANTQQLSFLDSYNSLTEREKKFLEKSWAKPFAENIFPKIDETPYAVLYIGKGSRPNTPVNIQIGTLIIKEFMGLSDDELLAALMFDIRFQYALHTTSYIEQSMSDCTLGRFRERCSTYERDTGIVCRNIPRCFIPPGFSGTFFPMCFGYYFRFRFLCFFSLYALSN